MSDFHPAAAPKRLHHRERRAALLSLGVSLVLLVVKFTAYFITHSNAIFSDAVEGITNVLAATFALYSISVAHLPADESHPYGHGKIEFFSAGLDGAMILLAGVLIVGKVIVSLIGHEQPVEPRLDLGVMLMTAALLINGAFGFYLWRSGRRGNALTLEASGLYLLTDAIDSGVVIVALLLVWLTGMHWIDNAAALAVAGYIVFLGLGLVRRSTAGLMDRQDEADEKLLKQILDAHIGPGGKEPRICSYHKLRHRHSGRYHWVDFHIMVPAWWDISRGHRIASSIEYEIELALGEGNATAHVEPCTDAQCPNCQAAMEREAAQAAQGPIESPAGRQSE